MPINDALIWLSFDADANDQSGNNNNGILTNGASISTATKKVGAGSLELDNDAGNQYVNLANHINDIANNTNGSFSFWFRLNEKNTIQGLVTVGDFGNVNSRFRVMYNNATDEINVGLRTATWLIEYETVTNGFALNTWYHIVLTQDGTASKLYINGAIANISGGNNVNSGSWFSSMTNLDTFRIGARSYSDAWFLDGFVDEFAYYSRALSASEVSDLYNNGAGANPYPAVVGTNILNELWNKTINGKVVNFYRTEVPIPLRQNTGANYVGGWYGVDNSVNHGAEGTFSQQPTQANVEALYNGELE